MPVFEQELVKLIISTFSGFMLGFARRGHPAGIRTFALISIGSTIFTLISVGGYFGTVGVDNSRLVSQIIVGIGFIGAGVIWKQDTNTKGSHVRGLTTAAAIWATAAVGILIGLGDYSLALATAFIIFLILLSKSFFKNAGVS